MVRDKFVVEDVGVEIEVAGVARTVEIIEFHLQVSLGDFLEDTQTLFEKLTDQRASHIETLFPVVISVVFLGFSQCGIQQFLDLFYCVRRESVVFDIRFGTHPPTRSNALRNLTIYPMKKVFLSLSLSAVPT